MAETVYNRAKRNLMLGDLHLDSDDIRSLLLRGSVTINPDHTTVAAVLAANDECDDASYGRVAATGGAVTQNDTDNRSEFDINDLDYDDLDNETPTAVLIFQQVTNDADSVPISIHDTGFGAAANGAGYVISFPNNVLRLT